MCENGSCGCGSHRRRHYPERGWIQFLILRMLYEKQMYGYQLMAKLEERGFVLPNRLESGAVYTILRRMESHGLLKSEWERIESGRQRRIYEVTEEGVETLKMGLKTIIKRKTLMNDLASFYLEHFQQKNDNNE